MDELALTPENLAQIEQHGISEPQLVAMVEKLRQPRRYVDAREAATCQNGIVELPNVEALAARFDKLRDVPGKFTPMSGAASRMFAFLERARKGNAKPEDSEKVQKFVTALQEGSSGPKFAFDAQLKETLARVGQGCAHRIENVDIATIVSCLLDPKGLGFTELPKALIPFHLRHGRPVCPLEEHLREALEYAGGRLHATISPEHQALYERELPRILAASPELAAVRLEFSVQDPATDAVAIDKEIKDLVREGKDGIVFFPAGHGSLLRNLERLGRPAVLRNVDNVPKSARARQLVNLWHRAFAVLLADIKGVVTKALFALEAGQLPSACLEELRRLGLNLLLRQDLYDQADPDARRGLLERALRRPIKIVGVVKNQGEPGGGPFVIQYGSHDIISIVEKDEIGPDQQHLLKKGQFFNPVDILVDPTDHRGKAFDLSQYANHDRYFVVEKPFNGKDVLRLEHPGLWNGAMDGWNAVFVAMPLDTFAPVKEVNDLLRPDHQAD